MVPINNTEDTEMAYDMNDDGTTFSVYDHNVFYYINFVKPKQVLTLSTNQFFWTEA
jgi:hypothetical protein